MHGGAVVAIPLFAFAASVTLRDGDGGYGHRLIEAALARVGASGHIAEWDTDIPRGVGLAGSSALVLAALKASGRAPSDPLALAELALSVERDDLGIPAGLQDRATQAFAHPVLVDLACTPPVRVLCPGAPMTFVVAWDPAAAGDSGAYHRGRELSSGGMVELARLARAAADAFEQGDAAALEARMGESAAVRDEVAPLPPAHNALAERVRRAGLVPNSTGSGGAVVAVVRGPVRMIDDPTVIASFDSVEG